MEASIEKINYTVFTQIKINVIQKNSVSKHIPTAEYNIWSWVCIHENMDCSKKKNVRHATVPPTKLLPALSAS